MTPQNYRDVGDGKPRQPKQAYLNWVRDVKPEASAIPAPWIMDRLQRLVKGFWRTKPQCQRAQRRSSLRIMKDELRVVAGRTARGSVFFQVRHQSFEHSHAMDDSTPSTSKVQAWHRKAAYRLLGCFGISEPRNRMMHVFPVSTLNSQSMPHSQGQFY